MICIKIFRKYSASDIQVKNKNTRISCNLKKNIHNLKIIHALDTVVLSTIRFSCIT